MLKNIQNNLLLRHPLLWNIKFIPALLAVFLINIIFFIYGYMYGRIDFTSLYSDNYRTVSDFVTSFSIIISILVLVVWLVFYLRNNAFKSFYPKGKNSLYKEWILLFIICILNCSYSLCFEYAYKLRARHYFPEDVAAKRMDIISRASLFIDGSFHPTDPYEVDLTKTPIDSDEFEYGIETTVVEADTIKKDSVCYYGILYHSLSLMNKNTIKFSLQVREKDSTNEFTVKRWMYDQKRDSIQKLLSDFLVIAKEHNLKPNISLEQWMNMAYLPKHYTVKQVVGRDSVNPIEIDHPLFDTVNNYVKIEHEERVAYPKLHVPLTQLETAYNRISSAYFAPIEVDYIIVVLYFGFAASLLIFSFRVTSGKS